MLMTGVGHIDAERAFARAHRSRRRAALGRWLRRERGGQLPVSDAQALRGTARSRRGVREIPLTAIHSTTEPSKAEQFDCAFRPAGTITRRRWERIWAAEQRGVVLPPISVVAVGDGYAIRDGHHRVSVARARGALAIDAAVELT
jgi:hypothetical protein